MITVLGLGFVGLTTALGFCDKGLKVFGYDVDRVKIGSLKHAEIPYHEPFLGEKLGEYLNNRFEIVENLSFAAERSQIFFICVGTPSRGNSGADLSFVDAAVESLLMNFPKDGRFRCIVIKSTVPPGTTKDHILPVIREHCHAFGETVGLANNPEFLREGFAWEDFTEPDRVVVGVSDEKSGQVLENIYYDFDAPFHQVSLNTGEFIKYLSNTLLSTMISFANDMSMAADVIGDIDKPRAFRILHQDKRWYGSPGKMTSYVFPGCGFGGYCLPKDTEAMYAKSAEMGYAPKTLKAVMEVNRDIKNHVVKVLGDGASPEDRIGILGLSFKPGSDDVRETPSAEIISMLIQKGYDNIWAYDPMAADNFKKIYNLPIKYASSLEELVENCDHFLLLTCWEEFVEKKRLFDGTNLLDFRYCLD